MLSKLPNLIRPHQINKLNYAKILNASISASVSVPKLQKNPHTNFQTIQPESLTFIESFLKYGMGGLLIPLSFEKRDWDGI